MICPKCGNEINEFAASCPHCGAEVTNDDKSKPVDKDNLIKTNNNDTVVRPKKKHRVLKTVLILFLTIAVGFGGYKGWGFVSGKFAHNGSDDGVILDADVVNKAMEELRELAKEAFTYQQNNPIGGVDTNLREASKEMHNNYKKFKEIEGLTDNVYDAANEMFYLLDKAYKNCSDVHAYLEGYLCMTDAFYLDPSIADEGNSYDYIVSAFRTLSKNVRNSYEQIDDVPLFDKQQYDSLGEFVDGLDKGVLAMQSAVDNADYLDLLSSIYYCNHKFAECVEEQVYYSNIAQDHAYFYIEQNNMAVEIYNEIGGLFELTDPYEIASYEFKNVHLNGVKFKYDPIATIYPSLYNSYRYFLRLELGNISGKKDICVECQIPGLTENYKEIIHLDGEIGLYDIKPEPIKEGGSMSVAREGQMNVTISETDGTVIDVQTFPVHIASKNEFNWQDDEFAYVSADNILCFLTPDSEGISSLKESTETILSEITDGKMTTFVEDSDVVYNEYLDVYLYAASAMMALSDSGVRYDNSGFLLDGESQNIKLPEEVLESRSGLCIETSLTIASLFMNAGFNAYIIFPPGHAQVAIETHRGSGEYILIETTRIPNKWEDFETYAVLLSEQRVPSDNNLEYPIAYLNTSEWMSYLDDEVLFVVKCDYGKEYGLTPFAN